jgi:predicted RNase H-like HicB family nuclease
MWRLSRNAFNPGSKAPIIAVTAMKTYNFKVVIEPDEDFDGNLKGFHAYCPALDSLGGVTWGATEAEALKNMNDVIHVIVDELIEEGKPIPEGPEGSAVRPYRYVSFALIKMAEISTTPRSGNFLKMIR